MLVIIADGNLDRLRPTLLAEGFDVFTLSERDGLKQGLGKIANGGGGSGLEVAFDDGEDGAAECCAEIASGEVVSREEIRQVVAEFISGSGLCFFAGVEEAEVGMVPGARSAATAAIGEGESTHGGAVLCVRGHGFLLKLN